MTTTPAYAQAKRITSLSGRNAAVKHRETLRKARALLLAQGAPEATEAAKLMTLTIKAYSAQIAAWYESDNYRNSWIGQHLNQEVAL